MFTRSKATQFVVASALALASLVMPTSPANALVAVAPNGTEVAMAWSHVVAIDPAGKVWTWGQIYPGEGGQGTYESLSRPTEVTKPAVNSDSSRTSFAAVSVAAGDQSSVVVTTEGEVFAWGYAGNGLGNGTTYQTPMSSPIKVSFPAGVKILEVSGKCGGYLARSDAGAVYQWGSFNGMWSSSTSTPREVLAAGSVTRDAAARVLERGCSSAYALKENGSIFAWGTNGGGKLGNGSTTDSATPVTVSISGESITGISASGTHALAVTASGKVFGWGGNSNGQLARNPEAKAFSNVPIQIGAVTTAIKVVATDSGPTSSFITSDGKIYNWGSYYGNYSGENSYSPTLLPKPDDQSTKIVSGAGYQNGQAFIGQDGSIWTRGLYGRDGNCGAEANSYPTWINGRMQAARNLVRVFSTGQFGSTYSEDELSINSLKTSDGSVLKLDGSGLVSLLAGDSISIEAARPSSKCFSTSELSFAWELDGDGDFSEEAVVTSDSLDNALVTGSTTLNSVLARTKGGLKVTNPDGFYKVFDFDVRVSARTQNAAAVGDALPYVGRTYNYNGASPGVAIGTNGKLYAWGSEDLTGNNSQSPVLLQTDPGVSFIKTSSSTNGININDHQITYTVGAALSSDGKIYAWGRGPNAKMVDTNDETFNEVFDIFQVNPAVISPPDATDPAIDFVLTQNGLGVALTESGRVWVWGAYAAMGISMDENVLKFSPPLFIPDLVGTSKIRVTTDAWSSVQLVIDGVWSSVDFGNLFQIEGDYGDYQLILQNVPTQALSVPAGSTEIILLGNSFVGSVSGTWKTVDGNDLESPSNSPIKEIRTADFGNYLLQTEDGALWQGWNTGSNPPIEWQAFKGPGSTVRFAGPDTSAWIAPDGSIKGGGGTCSNDSEQAMHSDGNLGPANSDDGVDIFLTSENALNSVVGMPTISHAYADGLEGAPFIFGDSNGGGGGQSQTYASALHIYPSNSQQVTITVGSACVSRSNISVKLDLDDDGVFETDTTLAAMTTSKTPTRVFGFTSNLKRGEITLSDLDFTNAGGSYIGVKVESTNVYNNSNDVSTVRLPIVVDPRRPTAKYSGVSINRGAEFTESADVTLSLTWPAGAITADISNDGGFEKSQNVPLSATTNWRLSDLTSGKVGSSVYVKFLGLQATLDGSWQETDIQPGPAYSDNITMDLTPPVVSAVDASVSTSQSNSLGVMSSFTSKIRSLVSVQTAPDQVARISVSAFDSGSGISAMQIANDPAVPGQVLPYQASITRPVTSDTLVLRVKDEVGNWSAWKYVKISGFRNIVPVTPTPTPSAPSNPTLSPAPTETSRPVVNPPSQSTPAKVTPPLTISLKAKVTTTQIAKSLKVTVPAKAKLTITVAKSSKAICKVVGGKLVAIKPGNCNVTLAVQGPKKAGKLPKSIIKSGKVVFKK